MSLAEENYLWILEHQILPNHYGLKRVALARAIDLLKASDPLAASSSPAPDVLFSERKMFSPRQLDALVKQAQVEAYEAAAKIADDSREDEEYGHAAFRCVLIAQKIRALEPTLSASSPAWEPIETAPKDGSRILAWTRLWKAPMTVQYYGTRWSCDVSLRFKDQPTHWMPLPPTPKEQS